MNDAGFDVARARRETPGVPGVIHFNNAGAGLMPQPVLDSMVSHLRLEAEIGAYEAAERSQWALDRVYHSCARLLSCDPDEIAITDSATRAWALVFYAIPLTRGDRILASSVEYGSNRLALQHVAARTGAVVEVIPDDDSGQVDVDGLRAALDERVKVIVMTHVPSNGGLVNPVASVGGVARAAGVPYLVDACQSIGQLPLDVQAIGCDFLAGCGRKYLRGPRGTGILYVRREALDLLDPPYVGLDGATWVAADRYELAASARRFETWEANCAARIGLGAAVDYALDWDVAVTAERTCVLGAQLRDRLDSLSGITVVDRGRQWCGLVSFLVDGQDPRRVCESLSRSGVNIWMCMANAACVDMESRGLDSLLRASVHYYNTEHEIDRLCALLEGIVAGDGAPLAGRIA